MSSKTHYFLFSFFYLWVFSLQAELAVTPTRVDLNEKNKNASITLISQAKHPITYKIGWIHYTMKSDGSYTETTEPRSDSAVAESLIRYSPRQVRLEPGETQVVRLSLKRNVNILDGEYRSHMVFRADPTSFASGQADDGRVSINLMVAKGIAIPIVVRKGNLNSEAKIISAEILKTTNSSVIKVEIQRSGNASTFGDVEVRQTVAGKTKTIALLKGVAVFLEIVKRTVSVPLLNPDQKLVESQPLHVLYVKPQEQGAGVIAEARFNP